MDSFLVTTLEAAISYIKSLDTSYSSKYTNENDETSANSRASANNTSIVHRDIQQQRTFSTKEHFIEYLFEKLKAEDEIEIIKLLKTDKNIEIELDDSDDDENKDDGIVEDKRKFKCSGNECYTVDSEAESICNDLCKFSACRLNIRNRHGIGAMHFAAMNGLVKMLNTLMALGADIKITDENNFTPLHYASAKGHQNILLVLLHSGADINVLTNDKFTPLHLAAMNGHENCVKALLYYSDHMRVKIDKNAQNKIGDTALQLAAKWGFTEIVETLLEYGVKTDSVNRMGHTALDYAHNSHILSLLQNVFVVIDHSEAEETWDTNSTPVIQNHELFRGCLTTSTDETDSEHSHKTRKTCNDKIVAAIRNGDTKLAFYFLGIDITEEEDVASGCHPLCTCDKCNLISKQRQSTELNQRTLKPSYTGNINECSVDGINPLHAAVHKSNTDLIEKIFLLGGLVSSQSKSTQQTALHYAILSKCHKTTELILSHIVDETNDINLQDSCGDTALHLAVETGNIKLVESLLRHDSDVNMRNSEGKTPLDLAQSLFQLNISRLLELAQ